MIIENKLHTISVVIANAAPVSSGTYELVVIEQRIYLRKRKPANEHCPVLARLESTDINNGISSGLWGFIKYRISDFLLRGILK
jgi:hypothetical protein